MAGSVIRINGDILCRYKGVVTPDYVCSRHRYAATPIDTKAHGNKCYYCEFFVRDLENSDSFEAVGHCRLFSVRKYNGREKNGCSKFSRKSQVDVS